MSSGWYLTSPLKAHDCVERVAVLECNPQQRNSPLVPTVHQAAHGTEADFLVWIFQERGMIVNVLSLVSG